MKRVLTTFGILLYAVLFSCHENFPVVENAQVPADIISLLEAAGFRTNAGLFKYGDGYIVEHDIFLIEKEIHQLAAEHSGGKQAKGEHYRTTSLVKGKTDADANRVIRIFVRPGQGEEMYGIDSLLDIALERYNDMQLSLTFEKVLSHLGADIVVAGAHNFNTNTTIATSTFPRYGNPGTSITVNLQQMDYVTPGIIAHEIGHCIGFRHSDYMDRSFSCGGSGAGDEGDAGVDALNIAGTPVDASVESWMLACSGIQQDRRFTDFDIVALRNLYPRDWRNNPVPYGKVVELASIVSRQFVTNPVGSADLTILGPGLSNYKMADKQEKYFVINPYPADPRSGYVLLGSVASPDKYLTIEPYAVPSFEVPLKLRTADPKAGLSNIVFRWINNLDGTVSLIGDGGYFINGNPGSLVFAVKDAVRPPADRSYRSFYSWVVK